MSTTLDKIGGMSVDEINKLRVNAKQRLLKSESDENASAILDAIEAELERRYIPGMIATFQERYPDGFYGDAQAESERNYKVAACEKFAELLNKSEFGRLLQDHDFEELVSRVALLVNATNFIQGSFEKPKLLDAIRANKEEYLKSLYDCLWGEGEFGPRLQSFLETMEDLKLNKWTYVSYFLFLSDSSRMMFVKPEMLKRSLEITKYPLYYDSKPSVDLYEEILKFSAWLKSNIAILKPRDMIDVHSFMWHMAPTGKWSEG